MLLLPQRQRHPGAVMLGAGLWGRRRRLGSLLNDHDTQLIRVLHGCCRRTTHHDDVLLVVKGAALLPLLLRRRRGRAVLAARLAAGEYRLLGLAEDLARVLLGRLLVPVTVTAAPAAGSVLLLLAGSGGGRQ